MTRRKEPVVTTISSREFNQDVSRAKTASRRGPVFITDRGRPSHVLVTIEEYQRLAGGQLSLLEAIATTVSDDVDFEPPRRTAPLHRAARLG